MTKKRKGDKWILQGIALPTILRNRKMAGIAETKMPAFVRPERESKISYSAKKVLSLSTKKESKNEWVLLNEF